MIKKIIHMLQWLDRFVSFFVPMHRLKDSEEVWFARSAIMFAYMGLWVAGIYAVFYWKFEAYGASISLAVLTLVFLVTLPLHLIANSRSLAKMNLAAASICLGGVVLHMGGMDSSAACWMLGVTPGVTALYFRRAREIFQLTALTIVIYCGVCIAELSGYPVYQFAYAEGSLVERLYTFVHFLGFSIINLGALAIFATTQQNLLRQVERQAREVKAILSNIRQGIFTLDSADLRIGEEYSTYLETITETKNLKDLKAIDLIFKKAHLTQEQIDMVEGVLSNSISEASFNFDVNEGNLIRELIFTSPNGNEKKLLMDWQPIIDDKSDVIEKMLVTVSDVTELQKIKNQNRDQQRQIDIIVEIIEISHEKFENFIRSSNKFLEENLGIIESGAGQNQIKALFINMHTLKGAARTYGFKQMTSIIHDCEQYYAQIQRGEKIWGREEALEHLRKVKDVLDEYTSISRAKLKRGNISNQISLDLEAVRENVRLLQDIEGFEFDERLTPFLENVKKTFYGLYYLDVNLLFDELFRALPSLAKDLGKANPNVEFRAENVGISLQGCEVIRNAFVHVLRNSMDHGLETSETRLSRGKSQQGTIRVDISVAVDETLQIIYADDGAGLNLSRIHQKGVENKLIHPEEKQPQKVAELIFDAGLSTASQVTDISGRGVGMGAVREFFEQIGGRVDLRLTQNPSELEPTPFEFILILPQGFYAKNSKDDRNRHPLRALA